MGKEPTIKERLLVIETILKNEIRHELLLHRWLLGMILTGYVALTIAIVARLLIGGI